MKNRNRIPFALLALFIISLVVYLLPDKTASTGITDSSQVRAPDVSVAPNSLPDSDTGESEDPLLPEISVQSAVQEGPEREIVECNFDFDPEKDAMSPDERIRRELLAMDSVIEYLTDSTSPDERVLYTVLATDLTPESRVEKLAQLVNDMPDNKLASLHLLQACADSGNAEYCNEDMVEHAIELNEENGLMWFLVASRYMAKNDSANAYIALNKLKEAPSYDDYFSSQLESIYNASRNMLLADPVKQSSLQYSSSNMATRAIDLSLKARLNEFSYDQQLCENLDDKNHLNTCLEFGSLIESEGTTILAKRMGKALSNQAARKLGIDEADLPSTPDTALQDGEPFDDATANTTDLLQYDSQLADEWIEFWINNDEVSALEFARLAAETRSQDPDYDPCTEYLEKYAPRR